VIIDTAFEKEEHPSVVLDNYRAGALAGDHLAALGHKRLACVTGPLRLVLVKERLKGFRDALARYGIHLEEPCIAEGDFTFESALTVTPKLFEGSSFPTAVWAQNDDMAAGVLKHLAAIGLSVPRDVALVGMDDASLAHKITPGLTTVAQPFAEMARKAVELVLRHKEENPAKAQRVTVVPSLVVRESTARI